MSWWLKYVDDMLSYLIIYFVIALIWIGAEYTIEGAVHTSCVDAIMCSFLSGFILQKIGK